ncbi:MAG: hypothetical protein LBC98_09800 [Prevotellaceae bacterium]|jgi:hypothetical protein|nr:hypothetical protein [Prevotellaceae bacterium]
MNKIFSSSLILAFCLGSLVSCWEENSVSEYEAFGIIEENNGKLCMRDDNENLLVPAQSIYAFVSSGDRAWMLFTAERKPQKAETIEVNLYDISKLHECTLQVEGTDTIGNDGIALNKLWIAQDFLTFDMMVAAFDEYTLRNHSFVIYSDMQTRNDTLYMEFRHKAHGNVSRNNMLRTGATLRLNDLQFGRTSIVLALKITDLDEKTEIHYCRYTRKIQ